MAGIWMKRGNARPLNNNSNNNGDTRVYQMRPYLQIGCASVGIQARLLQAMLRMGLTVCKILLLHRRDCQGASNQSDRTSKSRPSDAMHLSNVAGSLSLSMPAPCLS